MQQIETARAVNKAALDGCALERQRLQRTRTGLSGQQEEKIISRQSGSACL